MAAEVGVQSPCVLLRVVVCYACAAFEGAPTVCGMQRWACWIRGLPRGRGGRGVGSTEKRIEMGVTFEQCRQEGRTQFSIRAVKHHEHRGKMEQARGDDDDDDDDMDCKVRAREIRL